MSVASQPFNLDLCEESDSLITLPLVKDTK